MNTVSYPRTRRPTPPGELLNEEFLKPMKLTRRALAAQMGYEVKTIHRLIHERTKVTPEMARALSKVLGTSAELWLNLQNSVDLFDQAQSSEREAKQG